MRPRIFCLNFFLAIGDVTVLTALARDLKTTHPEHKLFVDCGHSPLWLYNPHIRPAAGVVQAYRDVEHVRIDYSEALPRAGRSGGMDQRTVHFLKWLYEDFATKTGIEVPTLKPHGDFHFSDAESARIVPGRYWVVLPGGKSDFPVKLWDMTRWQTVVDRLTGAGLTAVQLGRTGRFAHVDFIQHRLRGVIDLVDKTDVRQMLRLIRDAEGVICGVTSAMHMAAALGKPCVVLGGGKEAWWWEAYVNENTGFGSPASGTLAVPHRYLHTIGSVQCPGVSHHGGCWKRYVEAPYGACTNTDVAESGVKLPACMKAITVDHVLEAVLSYYEDGTLPPISPVTRNLAGALFDPGGVVMTGPSLVATPIAKEPTVPSIFDHPTIGGKFTVFSLLYGDHHGMHRKHLDTLLATTDPSRVEIRILANELCPSSVDHVERLLVDGRIASATLNPSNDRKYPVMRRAFRDPDNPIRTPYVIWCDDDTLFDKAEDWLTRLAHAVVDGHAAGARLHGPKYSWVATPAQVAWLSAGSWWRGKLPAAIREEPDARGSRIWFATGSFWALATDVIHQQDIPDPRLGHNGGDWTIGEQVAQGGWQVNAFSNNKTIVNWSAFPRRGITEPFPG